MIGVFDSGIGGVTVFGEIIKVLPNYKYIYYSDSLNNPYGDRSVNDLQMITKNVVKYLMDKGCQIIVIACNTASAMCKDFLRSEFDIPIIAIEPAIKMVDKGKTLVMATKGTLESEKFLELYKKYGSLETEIYECVGLADLIEQNNISEIKNYLKEHLKQFRGVKNVVLGCTHYPLIKAEIKEVLGNVNFYDGSRGVVKQLERVIKEINLEKSDLEIKFVNSSNSEFKKLRFYNWL